MTSQGQRFRRRALRRGYKVDEVDSFRPSEADVRRFEAEAQVIARLHEDFIARLVAKFEVR